MPMSEIERLESLKTYAVLDTPGEPDFDRLTQLAAELFDAPIALISLLDGDRQWFKSRLGLDASETPRAWAFCDHAIRLGPDANLVVSDASSDSRFASNPLVTGEPNIRFYAGATLTTPSGANLGTLCVIDTTPRAEPSSRQLERLTTLARLVVGELELRRSAKVLAEHQRLLNMAETMSGVGRWRIDLPENRLTWSDEVYRIHGVDQSRFNPEVDGAIDFYHPEDQAIVAEFVERAAVNQEAFTFQLRLTRTDGQLRHVVCKAECELNQDGTTRTVLGVFQDITDHVVALQLAEQSRLSAEEAARHAAIAEETAGLGHWRVSYPGRSISCSPQMLAVFGLPRGTTLDIQSILAMTHPDDLAAARDRLDRDLRGEPSDEQRITRIIRADGAVRWVASHTKLERDEAGRIKALVGTLMDVTRQTLAEREIGESEARYRLLTENSHDLIIKIGLGGSLLYVSPSITALLGYTPEEVLGLPAENLVFSADLNTCRAVFAAAAAGNDTIRSDYRLVRADGSVVWIDARPKALRDETTGEITAVSDVIRDVTARKAAEAELAKSEARFRLLADNASDIVTESDLDGRFRYVSPAVEAVTGYTVGEVVGRHAVEFVHPDDRDRVAREIAASILTPNSPQIEHRHIRKDGQVIWVESRPTLARDAASGKPFAVTDVLRDITARKSAEAALAATEMRFRHLADHASDMIARYDLTGTFLYLSPAVEFVLGYAPEELVGSKTFEIIHPDDHAAVAAHFADYIKQGPTAVSPRVEYRAIHKDRRVLWFEAHPTALHDGGGRPYEFMDIVRDVTARKSIEIELECARMAAEAATVVKSEFLSNMSHELRTPLTSILGFASLLEGESGLSVQGQRAVERVSGSSHALLTIVNDILDFSKLEAGQVEIERRAARPGEVMRGALALLEPQAEEKGLWLAMVGEDALPAWVMIDDDRVRQILLNLIGNAVKFTDTGGVKLNVSYDTSSQSILCEVIDSGPGISPDKVDRLFKRFSQVDGSTTRAFGGTGLGLAICRGLVEAMGGEIGVTSKVGKGACFWFKLPCPVTSQPAMAINRAGEVDGNLLEGLRLLVADDNSINRELIRVMVAPHGVDVTEAENGEIAVAVANEAVFDIILMDIRMPCMDGTVAATLIRKGGGPNDITPILAFTADDADHLATYAASGLFDDHVAKPISQSDLIATIAKWVAPSFTNLPNEVALG